MCTLITKDTDGLYYPRKFNGYNSYELPSVVQEIIDDLIYYCNTYSDEEIQAINKEIEYETFCVTHKKSKTKKSTRPGYIYMLKCADKYKIGYSKDVDKRINQLDTRPFKLELVFKAYSDNAYEVEQELHNRLDAYRETGEWYSNINEEMIKNMLVEIGGYLKCDIQF